MKQSRHFTFVLILALGLYLCYERSLFKKTSDLYHHGLRTPKGTAQMGGNATKDCSAENSQPRAIFNTGKTRGFHSVFVYSNVQEPMIKSYSQVNQDNIILRLSQANDQKRDRHHNQNSNTPVKYFVDLASNDALQLSNTLHLEQNGWNGLCIEPNPMYWYRLAAFRQCTIIGAFVGGTEDGKEVDVILSNHVFGGIVGQGFDNEKSKSEEKRNLVTISTIFKESNVPHVIDYMSLDVEGAESLVMRDFPFDDYKVLYFTIERPKDDLRELLMRNGYRSISRRLSGFGETLWFHEKSIELTPQEVEDIACNSTHNRCF
jgi:hypothetical protein